MLLDDTNRPECGLCYALYVEVETGDVAREVESMMGCGLFFVY
jgi:hypothetical protein